MRTADDVKETTTSVGTGPLALGGAVTPHFSRFAAVFPVGTRDIAYLVVDQSGSDFEWGSGTLITPTRLSRDTVLGSANEGRPVAFAAGVKHVMVAQPGGALAAFEPPVGGPQPSARPGRNDAS